MKNSIKNILTVLASVVTGGICSWLFLHDDVGLRRKFADSRAVSSVENGDAANADGDDGGNVSEAAIEVSDQKYTKDVGSGQKSLNDEKDADEELNSLQRAILDQLQLALDNNDLAAVRKAIAKFSSSGRGGLGGNVPNELKDKAIGALSWFGKDGAMDLVAFVCDPDDGISEEAFDKLEEALNDSEMSDYERAEYVKALLRAVSDEVRIDSIMLNLMDMRNSVRADTIISILQEGTPKAVEKMQEDVGFYADDEVKTIEDVRQWKKNNPDDENDDDFYGKK